MLVGGLSRSKHSVRTAYVGVCQQNAGQNHGIKIENR
jgi:hypothetical protein